MITWRTGFMPTPRSRWEVKGHMYRIHAYSEVKVVGQRSHIQDSCPTPKSRWEVTGHIYRIRVCHKVKIGCHTYRIHAGSMVKVGGQRSHVQDSSLLRGQGGGQRSHMTFTWLMMFVQYFAHMTTFKWDDMSSCGFSYKGHRWRSKVTCTELVSLNIYAIIFMYILK